MQEFALELRHISKRFGQKVLANNDVSLSLRKGEILSLLGENGSGKTTLMNMISGIYSPDKGEILVDGMPATIASPKDAYRYNIGMVHQHFKLIDIFTAAENIILGNNEPYSIKEINRKVSAIAEKYGFEIDPKKKICDMSVSEKQTVEIIKVLYRGANILILDEPTAVLTPQEIDKLFAILRKMKEDGKSVIIITHKLNEVLSISDRVSILRKGEHIATVNTSETNEKELTEMMVGKKVDLEINRTVIEKKKPLLEIRNLTVKSDDGNPAVKNVNFYIRGGEILGVAGISGCGQKELCEAIAGLRKIDAGQIMHKGESIVGLSAKKIIEKGISMSFIPEDRLGMGLAPSFSITDNMMLKNYCEGKTPFVNRKAARERAAALIKRLEVVTPSTETPVRRLSGGNVQKILVGREIESAPNVIVTAYPVRGLDINSSYLIYDILNEERKKDVGVLFVGEDIDVMLALCDKILVLCHGEVQGVVHANKVTKEDIGLMMTGSMDLTKLKEYGIAKDSNLSEEEWKNAEIEDDEKRRKEGNKDE